MGAVEWVPRVAGNATAARRKWGLPPSGRHAGDVTLYAHGQLTYTTVAGAGHLVPADRPAAALAMMGAWLRAEPLPPYAGPRCKRLWLGKGYSSFC